MEIRVDSVGKGIHPGDHVAILGGVHKGKHGIVEGFTPEYVRLKFTYPERVAGTKGRSSDRFLTRSTRPVPVDLDELPEVLVRALEDPEAVEALAKLFEEESLRRGENIVRAVARRVARAARNKRSGSSEEKRRGSDGIGPI